MIVPVKALCVPSSLELYLIFPSKFYGETIAISWQKEVQLFCPMDDIKRLYTLNNGKA